MEWKRTEGIILEAMPFEERHLILTLFTRQVGRIRAVRRFVPERERGWAAPLHLVEVVWREGRGELDQVKELALIDPFSSFRNDWDKLSLASGWLRDLNRTQMPDGEAMPLYTLLECFLAYLKNNPAKESLAVSFRLKLLRYQGLLPELDDELYFLACSRSLKDIAAHEVSPSAQKMASDLWEGAF